MEENKNLKLIVIIIVAIIIIVTFIYLLYDKEASGITAMDGIDIANNTAKEWNQNANMVGISSDSGFNADGMANSWLYTYIANIDGEFWECRIVINTDLSFEQNAFQSTGLIDFPYLVNMSLDSTDVMEIALENETINDFIDTYGNCLAGMGVSMKDTSIDEWTNSTDPIWKIAWDYPTFNENYHRANIFIDATTGEVLSVDAD